jgi:hypothetical protein
MIRAYLNGKKTQTRRIVKLPPASQGWRFIECGYSLEDSDKFTASFAGMAEFAGDIISVKCPYGKPPDPVFGTPGDRLWVRETWAVPHFYDGHRPSKIPLNGCTVHYDATENLGGLLKRSPLFMPRWASRITSEITSVRAERLKDISDPDCWAEGIECAGWDPERYGSVVECYRDLWQSIHGPGSWDLNPLVWVVEFAALPAGEA